jgi:hypothetical protein
MSRFPVHFLANFGHLFMIKMSRNGRGLLIFNFHLELDDRPKAVEVVKKLLQSCWSMRPNHESFVDISEHFSGFVVSCASYIVPRRFP